MRKNLLLLCFFFSILLPPGFTQVKLKNEDKLADSLSYLENFDYFIKSIDKSKFPTSILYDRVVPLARLHSYNPVNPMDTSDYNHFIQAYYELYLASFSNTGMKPFSDIKKEVKGKNVGGVIPIGVINYEFNYIDPDALKTGVLGIENKQLKIKKGKSEFTKKTEACVFSLLGNKLKLGENTITFDKDFVFSNTRIQIASIDLNLGEGNGSYTLIPGEAKTVSVGKEGKVTITYSLTLTNGKKLTGYSQILVGGSGMLKVAAVSSEPIVPYCDSIRKESATAYTDYLGISRKGVADMLIYYSGCNDWTIKKPIIICDGFDPGNGRKGIGIYSLINQYPYYFADNLRANGFDIIIVNFPDGADFIVRNAYAMVEVIKWVNQVKTTSKKNIVVGPSMGGLITRYALAKMEKDGVDHQTSLWISFDSPHQGANIPIGDQYFLDFFGRTVNNAGAKEGLDKVNSPAARQMLVDHHLALTEVPTPSYYRTLFINELKNNGLTGSNGYPQNLRKVALLNGSGIREKQEGIDNVTYLLDMEVWKKIWIFGRIRVAQAYVTASADVSESRKLTFYGYCADEDDIGYYWETFHYSRPSTSPYFTISYDKAPGGSNPTQTILAEGNSDIVVNYPGHCFIPSVSALDLIDPDLMLNIDNANVVGNNRTPFAAYYAPPENQKHISFSPVSINWVSNEIYSAVPCLLSSISNTTYTTNSTISNCKINLYNVVVTNNANVVFDSESETTITGPFEVVSGSTLEVK